MSKIHKIIIFLAIIILPFSTSAHVQHYDDLNRIADTVLSIPHHKRTLSSVFKAAVFKKPSLVIDVLKVFASV